ncbi:Endoribonuclease YbeY [Capsicum chinense]|nr:Endoribonuclease YbeY [Capsicum chinense]
MPRSIMLAEDVRDEGPRHQLILRDIVISVETTSSQAEERGHSLLDEMHILPVHGLLHLLGFDHEISDEAEAEMEKEEELLLNA